MCSIHKNCDSNLISRQESWYEFDGDIAESLTYTVLYTHSHSPVLSTMCQSSRENNGKFII